MIIVIWGPAGSGKTTHSGYLKSKYACSRILDEWVSNDTREALKGDLLLTQSPSSAPKGSVILHIAEALRK